MLAIDSETSRQKRWERERERDVAATRRRATYSGERETVEDKSIRNLKRGRE